MKDARYKRPNLYDSTDIKSGENEIIYIKKKNYSSELGVENGA